MAVQEKRYPESLNEYLKEQMQNPVFAREFEKATRELDLLLATLQAKPNEMEEDAAHLNSNAG